MAERSRGSLAAVEELGRHVLRDVSRSFYLSLKLLPAPMRSGTSIAYLLARASDTLADTVEVPAARRIELLDGFTGEIAGKGAAWRGDDLNDFVARQTHPGERVLLQRLDSCFAALDRLTSEEGEVVRTTLAVIVSGQRLDLERFHEAGPNRLIALRNEEELEDYCYRVAGCVGEFWTRIGLLTLANRFATADHRELLDLGVRYGKGLQLVNILRDLPEDLAAGRCYLPVSNPLDSAEITERRREWLQRARQWVACGPRYASQLNQRRLRAASVLPALIGAPTLDLLESNPAGTERVKVGRSAVRRALWRAWWWPRQGN